MGKCETNVQFYLLIWFRSLKHTHKHKQTKTRSHITNNKRKFTTTVIGEQQQLGIYHPQLTKEKKMNEQLILYD